MLIRANTSKKKKKKHLDPIHWMDSNFFWAGLEDKGESFRMGETFLAGLEFIYSKNARIGDYFWIFKATMSNAHRLLVWVACGADIKKWLAKFWREQQRSEITDSVKQHQVFPARERPVKWIDGLLTLLHQIYRIK